MKTFPILTALLAIALASCSKPASSEAPKAETPKAEKSAPAAPAVTHVDAAAAFDLLEKDSDVAVLDVRTPGEYADGHFAGAINIDFRAPGFKEAVAARLDPEKPYLVHCKSGGRSTSSLEILKALGFQKVYHLDGGFSGWTQAGHPVEK